MKVQKIQLNFDRETDASLLIKAQGIITSLNKSSFPQPIPMKPMEEATAQFSKDLSVAQDLGKTNVKAKNDSRDALIEALVSLGLWIMSQADGDSALLIQSGYTISKDPQPRYIKPAGEISVSNGITSGQIIINGVTDAAAISYQFGIAFAPPTEDTNWTVYSSSRSKYVLDDLTRATEVWVRFAVIGARNQISYSNVVSHIVQ